jgi:hypothetical protein
MIKELTKKKYKTTGKDENAPEHLLCFLFSNFKGRKIILLFYKIQKSINTMDQKFNFFLV